MSAAIAIRDDFAAEELRVLAGRVKDANQARRLLALAAVLDGMDREEAARIGGMDRQTLRDWVHRFNVQGPDGLINIRPRGGGRDFRTSRKRNCASWWRPVPALRMGWHAGAA